MAPTPSSLRGAADTIRRIARTLELDFEPLAHKGDRDTWEGPAATAFRREVRTSEHRAAAVTDALRRLARRLDDRADDLQRFIDAEARHAEEQRLEARQGQPWRGGMLGPGVVPTPEDHRWAWGGWS